MLRRAKDEVENQQSRNSSHPRLDLFVTELRKRRSREPPINNQTDTLTPHHYGDRGPVYWRRTKEE